MPRLSRLSAHSPATATPSSTDSTPVPYAPAANNPPLWANDPACGDDLAKLPPVMRFARHGAVPKFFTVFRRAKRLMLRCTQLSRDPKRAYGPFRNEMRYNGEG